MWHRPSIAVNAIQASSRKQASNIINDSAWARSASGSSRTWTPGDADLLQDHLKKQAPWGSR